MANTKVTSVIKLNTRRLAQLDQAQITSLVQAADETLGDIKDAGIMPKDTGTLQDASTFLDDVNAKKGKVRIVSSTPYARRLYYHPEYNFYRGKNSRAGGKWFDGYLDGKFIKSAYKKLFKRNGGL